MKSRWEVISWELDDEKTMGIRKEKTQNPKQELEQSLMKESNKIQPEDT